MSEHTTHFEDCGCFQKLMQKEMDEWKSLAGILLEASKKALANFDAGGPHHLSSEAAGSLRESIAKAREFGL